MNSRNSLVSAARGALLCAATLLPAALLSSALGPAPARAQDRASFRVDRFAPAPSGDDGAATVLPSTLGHLMPYVGLTLDYAYGPLSARDELVAGPLVEHRVIAHLRGALGITDRVEVHLRVPFAFAGGGAQIPSFPSAEGFSMGDGVIGGTFRFLGEPAEGDARAGLWLGALAELLIPLGAENGFASDLEVGARAALTMSYGLGIVSLMVNAGVAYRPERVFENARSGTELEVALGMMFVAATWLDISFEVLGASMLRLVDDTNTDLVSFGSVRGTPAELRVGGHARTDLGISVDASIGVGLTSAVGVPAARITLGMGWGFSPEGPGDSDGDGFNDPDDECPAEAEDADGFEDGDGCPDPDDDGDGILDADDECPRQAEDLDGISDTDGCPDDDDDGDGLDSRRDVCPRAPGPDWTRGCPQLVRLDADRIELLRPILFEGIADLADTAEGVFEEILAILAVDPRMRLRFEVRGTGVYDEGSGRRRSTRTIDMSAPRADAVRAYLEAHEAVAPRVEVVAAEGEGEDGVTITILDRTPMPEAE